MATERSSLILNVKSDSVKESTDRLERFARASELADRSVRRSHRELTRATRARKQESSATKQATRELERNTRAQKRANTETSRLTKTIAKLGIATTATGLATAALYSSFRNIQTIQRLRIQLETATGSVDAAGIAFESLKELATDLPLSIQELTEGFVLLKNLGLDPSEEALISYTDTASALGKSLDDFIQAVADAATSEFERLKEFGIRAKQEGDRVRFTFRGITTEIGNNAAEIEQYLISLGQTNFLGAATKQMETLEGQISNLQVAWFNFTTAIEDGSGPIGQFFSRQLGFYETILNQYTQATKEAKAETDFFNESIEKFSSPGALGGRVVRERVTQILDIQAVLQATTKDVEALRIVLRKLLEEQDFEGAAIVRDALQSIEQNDQIVAAQNARTEADAKGRAGLEALIELDEYSNQTLRERLELQREIIQNQQGAIANNLADGNFTDVEKEKENFIRLLNEREKIEQQITAVEKREQDIRERNRARFWDNIITISGDANSTLAKAARGFAIADVTIKGIQAVQNALATGGPFPQNLISATMVAAEAAANVAAIRSAGSYNQGGIVPGSSFTGDSMVANVNSGEMILNGQQQAELFRLANGMGNSRGELQVEINNFGVETTVEQTQGDNGMTILNITNRVAETVRSEINRDIANGDGPTSRALALRDRRTR